MSVCCVGAEVVLLCLGFSWPALLWDRVRLSVRAVRRVIIIMPSILVRVNISVLS